MRENPNPRLYSLYINEQRVSTHAYRLEIAAHVFGKQAVWATEHGKKTELKPVRKGSKY
jgi:hypothetical protein